MKSALILLMVLFASSLTASAQRSFSGVDIDSQSGLSDCRNRVMDPETGTFLQKDPEGISGGLNTYIYCNNNPVNYIDPLGLNWFDNVVNCGTGVGDAVSFGGTRWLRSQFSFYDNTVNYNSGSYAGGQITGNVIAGAAVGAGGAALVIKGAPLAVAALDAIPGVTTVQASAAVTTTLFVGGIAGGVATVGDAGNAAINGNWNSFAFDIGTLGGGAAVGTLNPFGGTTSGGRTMADEMSILMTGKPSQAPIMNSLLDAFNYSKVSGSSTFLMGSYSW